MKTLIVKLCLSCEKSGSPKKGQKSAGVGAGGDVLLPQGVSGYDTLVSGIPYHP